MTSIISHPNTVRPDTLFSVDLVPHAGLCNSYKFVCRNVRVLHSHKHDYVSTKSRTVTTGRKRSKIRTGLTLRLVAISSNVSIEKRRGRFQFLHHTNSFKIAVRQMSDAKKNSQDTGASTYGSST